MKRSLSFLLIQLTLITCLDAQAKYARVGEDGSLLVETVSLGEVESDFRSGPREQLPGFPLAAPGDVVFKNFRNLTLADLNGDGRDEILFGAARQLLAYSADSLLWSRSLSGIALYPPSVADLDGDGSLEIVQLTGGNNLLNQVYIFDAAGQDLEQWPGYQTNDWMITAPALSDLDGDGQMEIVALERNARSGNGLVHIFRIDGSSFGQAWPVSIDRTPAVTPSVADLDNDGEKEIVLSSTGTQYVFDLEGSPEPGWPRPSFPLQRYSFQSPVLVDLDGDEQMEIVGATHGDLPEYYVRTFNGGNFAGWPQSVPGNNWTFSTPTVVRLNGGYRIFMSRPIGEAEDDMLYGWTSDGVLLDGFPIRKSGGLEGFISVADVDGDGAFELIFGSNLLGADGRGFIHAYEMNGGGEVAGFPLRPRGFTFMNGVNPGDIDGDGMMDLVAISYTAHSGSKPDTVYCNAYPLGVAYSPDRVLWSTYKGSNSREGAIADKSVSTLDLPGEDAGLKPYLYPNPAQSRITIRFSLPGSERIHMEIKSIDGRHLQKIKLGELVPGTHSVPIDVNNLPEGTYLISVVRADNRRANLKFVIKQP